MRRHAKVFSLLVRSVIKIRCYIITLNKEWSLLIYMYTGIHHQVHMCTKLFHYRTFEFSAQFSIRNLSLKFVKINCIYERNDKVEIYYSNFAALNSILSHVLGVYIASYKYIVHQTNIVFGYIINIQR